MRVKGFNIKVEGVIVPIVTPFREDERLNLEAAKHLTEWLIEQGVHGLLIAGSLGEAAKMSLNERKKLLDAVLDAAKSKVSIFLGTGFPDTKRTIELTLYAKDAGATGAVIIPPYYQKPSDNALYEHYKLINDSVKDYPILLYDIPIFACYSLSLNLIRKVAALENIIGLKDSSGNMSRFIQLLNTLGDKIAILQGYDILQIPSLILGSPGGVLGAGNVIAKFEVEIYNEFIKGNIDRAKKIFKKILPIIMYLMADNRFPTAYKEALNIMGLNLSLIHI